MQMEDIVSLCKRRGFIYQSCSLYGGLQGIFDYGPLGIELKNNIKKSWWKEVVHKRNDVFGLDSSILLHRNALKYSQHEDTFTDPLVDCRECKNRWRSDHIKDKTCPSCKSPNLTEERSFNLMLKTSLGPVEEASSKAYLRPETAQGIFLNFKNVVDSFSPTLPFGIAQIGKAFRNEITPRNFIFRAREFEQMELEYFVRPGEDDSMHAFWIEERLKWWGKQGLDRGMIECFQQPKEELSHYSKATTDLLFKFPHGKEELEGIANRTDFDLGSHTKSQETLNIKATIKENKESIMKLSILENGEWVVPYVIEPSAGVDRAFLAILTAAYKEEELEKDNRIVLSLKPHLAPIKAAIIPLAKNKPELVNYAATLANSLKNQNILPISLESGGNIGKVYRKHDEIGTPFCVTVDFETLEEKKDEITIRERDSMKQTRMHISDLGSFLKESIE